MKKRTKKILGGAVSLSLVAAIAVSGTYAYLTRQTETRVNNFTFADESEAIAAILTEPKWDGIIDYDYSSSDTDIVPIYDYYVDTDNIEKPIYGYEDGIKDTDHEVKNIADFADAERPTMSDTDTPLTTTHGSATVLKYGIDQQSELVPGRYADKDPIITNTGTVTDIWAAAKITFVYANNGDNNSATGGKDRSNQQGKPLDADDLKALLKVIEIDFNSELQNGAKWERAAGEDGDEVSQTFYYKEIVARHAEGAKFSTYSKTDPLFTKVSVKTTAENDDFKAVNEIGGFVIWIEGFAVQSEVAADYDGSASDTTYFKEWAKTGVKFNNTPTDSKPVPEDDLKKTYLPNDYDITHS